MTDECLLCDETEADRALLREEVWRDDHWRLTTVTVGEVAGFSFLEPRRHVPDITALDGAEAATLGPALAHATSTLKAVTGAELVYVYVFGGSFPHLHLHLAPHHEGGALNDSMIKGDVVESTLDSGAVIQTSEDYPPLPEAEHRRVIAALRGRAHDGDN